MIDLELAGVGVCLGVHQDALRRRPRRAAPTTAGPAVSSGDSTPSGSGRPTSSTTSSSSSLLDQQQNVLRLSLRKPGDWRWQLRTSASSPALLVPAVQLFDHRGRLLLDTSDAANPADDSPVAGDKQQQQQRRDRRRHQRRHHRRHHRATSGDRVDGDDAECWPAMAPALRSLDLDRPPASALAGPAGRAECRPHPGPVHLRVGGPGLGHAGSPPAPLALAAATRASERASMGSSGSRQPAGKQGLLGRRTQSSGSLCTAHADKLGRLLAPCGRHRQHGQHGPRHHCHNNYHNDAAHRHHRYKLCGSLPNHLDASRQDLDVCDNNNITPASPAVSEKDLQDLGYASERSPDDEKHFPGDMSGGACESVVLQRGSRGLGLSVCGGVDCAPDGLVRVKRLFPHQPAWQSGRLRPGDVLLAVNGEPLSGLTNHEALEVLRTASDHVVLTVARPSRPPSWAGPAGPGLGQPSPGPPGGTGRQGMQLDRLDPRLCRQDSCGELEVTLSKVQGSLGFTLRKEDSSALGHYVRALVREPALSDGRIRPGDKIVAVNGADISHLSHEEAVLFLRQAGDTVVLRLFRDLAQTPVTALSPTEAHKAFRPKALRKEALDMLSDLAVRRMAPGAGPGQGPGTGESSTLGRPRKVSDGRSGAGGPLTASQQHLHHRSRTQSFGEQPSHHHHHHHRSHELIASSQSGRGREESPLVELVDSTMSSSSLSSLSSSANSVVERPTGGASNASRARRPDFLHLGANGGSVGPSPATAPAWHLQKLTLAHSPGNDIWVDEGKSSDFASLPCGPASPDEDVDGGRGGAFSHRHPAYQSVNPTCRGHGGLEQGQARGGGLVDPRAGGADRLLQESSQDVRGGGLGRTGLLKWKGVVFTPEADDTDSMTSTPPDQDDTASQSTLEDSNGQVFTVELNRGWNSRLGFSLQSDGDYSVISAIYNDSVAAKNGKLKTGDRIIMVNDESVEGMPTPEVIDLFRKIRGPIAITVWREIQL